MRIARITALATIAFAMFFPTAAHADTVLPTTPGAVQMTGDVARGAINLTHVVTCRNNTARCR